MNPKNIKQIGRLAMRQEGGLWNAYYALPDSMDDPIHLGSIKMGAVVGNPDRKKLFMDMMRDVVSDIIQKETGVRPEWGEEAVAPEHERSGNA